MALITHPNVWFQTRKTFVHPSEHKLRFFLDEIRELSDPA